MLRPEPQDGEAASPKATTPAGARQQETEAIPPPVLCTDQSRALEPASHPGSTALVRHTPPERNIARVPASGATSTGSCPQDAGAARRPAITPNSRDRTKAAQATRATSRWYTICLEEHQRGLNSSQPMAYQAFPTALLKQGCVKAQYDSFGALRRSKKPSGATP